jgi:hypothetical protein
MKKGYKTFLIFAFILSFILILSLISSAEQPSYPLGINPEKLQEIPENPEEAANTTANYLKTEIGKIVSKIPGLVNVNEFFKAHPLFFTVVFNEPYNISWIFFCIVLFWLYTMALIGDLFNSLNLFKQKIGIIIGIAIAIILSQLGITKALVVFLIDLIFAQRLWWVRTIIGVLIILILMLIAYGEKISSDAIKANKKKQKEERFEQEVKEGKAFREGAEQAEGISEEVRKIKRKNPLM